MPDIAWHGARLDEPPWHDPNGRLLRFTIAGLAPGEEDLHVVLNMSEQAADLPLPPITGRRWHVAVDTARATPSDITAPGQQHAHDAAFYRCSARSVVVLEARA
jgi:glycogen operon protein